MNEWSSAEIQTLQEAKAAGKTNREIGVSLGRSRDSVKKKWQSITDRDRIITKTDSKVTQNISKFTPCKYPKVSLRGAVFDIETTSFKAGGVNDHLVCVCVLPLDGDMIQTVRMEFNDNRDDRRVLEMARDILEGFDIWSGHSISRFDIPWLNSRLIYHNLRPITKKFLIYDTYEAARRSCIKADRKSLAFLIDFFRMKQEKTAVLPVAWSMVDSPNRDEFAVAMNDIVNHCESDVRMTRELFYALWQADRSMMNLPVYRK